jgi:hypothetical protein
MKKITIELTETAYTNDEPFTRNSRKYGQRDLFGLWLQP